MSHVTTFSQSFLVAWEDSDDSSEIVCLVYFKFVFKFFIQVLHENTVGWVDFWSFFDIFNERQA
jgi:hypothetical protein